MPSQPILSAACAHSLTYFSASSSHGVSTATAIAAIAGMRLMSLGTVYDRPLPGETISDIFIGTNLVSNCSGRIRDPVAMVVDKLDIALSLAPGTVEGGDAGNATGGIGSTPGSGSLQVDGNGFAVRVWIAVNRPRRGVGPFNASVSGVILAHDAQGIAYARKEVLSIAVPDGRPVRHMTGSQVTSPVSSGNLRTSVETLYVITAAATDDPYGAYVAGSSVYELNPETLAWRLLATLPCCGAIYSAGLHMRAGMATLPYVGGATPPPSPSASLTASQTRTSSATASASPTAAAFMLGIGRVSSSAADAAGWTVAGGSGATASASPSTSVAPAATAVAVPSSVLMAAAAASACESASGGLPCVTRTLPPLYATLLARGCPATSSTTTLTCSSSAPDLVLVAPGSGISAVGSSSAAAAASFGTAVPCPFTGDSQGLLPYTIAIYANPMATDAAAAAANAAALGGAPLTADGSVSELAGDSPVQITCRAVSPGRGGAGAAPLVASASWAVAYRHDALPVMHDVLLYWPAQRVLRSARFGGTVRLGVNASVGTAADGNCSGLIVNSDGGSSPNQAASAPPTPSPAPSSSVTPSATPSRSVSASRKASPSSSPIPPAPACLSESWVRQQLPLLQQVGTAAQLSPRVLAATVAGAPLAIIVGARSNGSSAALDYAALSASSTTASGAALAGRPFGAPGDTAVSLGGRSVRVLWASADGSMMHIAVPSELCSAAAASATAGCGRQRLVLQRPVLPRRFPFDSDGSGGSDGASAVSSGNANASIAVACPPACPGVGSSGGAFAFVPAPTSGAASSLTLAASSSALAVDAYGVGLAAWPARGAGSDAPRLLAAPPLDGASAAVSPLETFASTSTALVAVSTDGSSGGSTAATVAAGLFFVFACPGATNPAVDADACRNASHPLFAGCMWGDGSAAAPCSSCPPNAICPGGRRVWPQAGYYSSSESQIDVTPCAPSPPDSPRCVRWDDAAGAVECGPAYQAGSYGCLLCKDGTYPVDAADAVSAGDSSSTDSSSGSSTSSTTGITISSSSSGGGGCAPCGRGSALLQLLLRASAVAGVLAGAAAAAFAILTLLARCMRTSIAGGALRFLDLLLFLFIAVQVIAEAGTSAGAAGELPAPARAVLRVAAAFAFEGIALHHACLRGLPPFLAEKLLFSAILIGEAVVVAMAAAAAWRRKHSSNDAANSSSGSSAALCCCRRGASSESTAAGARARTRARGRQPRIIRAVSRRLSTLLKMGAGGGAATAAAPVSAWEPGGSSVATAAGAPSADAEAKLGAPAAGAGGRPTADAGSAVASASSAAVAPAESPRIASILDGKLKPKRAAAAGGAGAGSAGSPSRRVASAGTGASARERLTLAGRLKCCAAGLKSLPALICRSIKGQAGYAICFALSVLYGRTAGTAFALLRCESVTMTLTQAAALDGADAAALTAVAVAAVAGDSSGAASAGSSSGGAAPLVTVSLLQSNPTFICYTGAHASAAGLAWFVLIAFLLGFPIFAITHAAAAKAALLRDGAPPDAVSSFLLTATYRPRRWYMKLADMALLAALAAIAAMWRAPTTPATLGGRAAARCGVLLLGAAALLVARPYADGETWRLPLRVAAALLASLVAVTTAVAGIRALPPASRQGVDDDALRAAAGGLSYTLLAGAAAFVLAAIGSVGWAMLRGAHDERRIAARLRAAEASEAAALAGKAAGSGDDGAAGGSARSAPVASASTRPAVVDGVDLYRATQLYSILADAAPPPASSASRSESSGGAGRGNRGNGNAPLRGPASVSGRISGGGAVPAFSPAGAASRHVAAAASLMVGRDVEAGSSADGHDDASDIASRLKMPMHQWRLLAAAAAASAERTGGSQPSGVSDGILRGLAAYGGLSTVPASFAPVGVSVPAPGLSRRERIAAAERARMSAAGDDINIEGVTATSAGGGAGASGRRESFVAFRNPLSA